MLEHLHVHIPYRAVAQYRRLLLDEHLHPEVAFKGPDLDALDRPALKAFSADLVQAGLEVTIHAPFMDLNPGSIDPLVLAATRQRFEQTLDAAEILRARLVVFHPGYDRWRYGNQQRAWIDQNLLFWPPLLRRAADNDCLLTLENIFEEQPEPLVTLLNELDSPWLGHCFDTGHWNLFAKIPLSAWLDAFGPRLFHVHLHDNLGQEDDHLPLGDGQIDFAPLFSRLAALPHPQRLTLEAHTRSNLERALKAVAPFLAS